MLSEVLPRAVSFSARKPLAILAGALVLAILAMAYSITHFDMSTDTGDLISNKTEWRRIDAEISKAFPQTTDSIVVVVVGGGTAAGGQRKRVRGMPMFGSRARWMTMMAAPIAPPVSPERDWVMVRCCVASGVERW